jgi:hypothetical protein
MPTDADIFQADFSEALANELGASTDETLQQLAPHYGALSVLYAAVAGRPTTRQYIDFQQELDATAAIVGADETLAEVVQSFGDDIPDDETQRSLIGLTKAFAESLRDAVTNGTFTGAGAAFANVIASALEKSSKSEVSMTLPEFYCAMSDVVTFSSPVESPLPDGSVEV